MPVVQQAADAARRRVVLIKFVVADRVTFHADPEHLAFHRNAHLRLVVINGKNFVQRIFEAQTRPQPVCGNVFQPVGDPDVDEGVRIHLRCEIFRDLQADLPVTDPEFAHLLIGTGQGESVFDHRMGKIRRVEIDAVQPDLLCKFHPRREMFGAISVSVHLPLVRAENGVACMKVEALFAGDQRKREADVLHQLFGRPCTAGIVARRLNAAARRAALVKADDVVALPAMHGNGDLCKRFDRLVGVDSVASKHFLCLIVSVHLSFSF